MAGKKKTKRNTYQLYSAEGKDHYTVRLSKEAYDKLADKTLKKFSKKLRKHTDFKLVKRKFK